MGTNYYLLRGICECCDRERERLHIGKSSAGWVFALHVEPDNPTHPQELDGWRLAWSEPGVKIIDEYGGVVSAADMEDRITRRSWGRPDGPAFDHDANHSQPGPNGLVRSKIDGRHCVGHGNGTYDLIQGEFS